MDLKQADLGLLLALDALLSEESVTGAAQRLGVSQPAMSAQLARLRALFNDPLLTPSGRKLVPTTRAAALQAPLQKLLSDLDVLVRENVGFDPETARDVFRLGSSDYSHAILAPDLARRLAERAPGVRLALLLSDYERIWADLEAGRLDAAVIAPKVALPEAKRRFLFRESFVFAQRKGHPRGDGPLDLDSFCALEHVLVSLSGGFVGVIDTVLSELGRERKVALSLPTFLLAPSIIAASDLVGVLPGRISTCCAEELDYFPLPFDLTGFDLQLVWHPRRQNDPAHIWFRDQVVALCREPRFAEAPGAAAE